MRSRLLAATCCTILLAVAPFARAADQCGPWTVEPVPPGAGVDAIVWGRGRFVAVGSIMALSADGLSWRIAREGLGSDLFWRDVATDGSRFVAVGSGVRGTHFLYGGTAVSDDGDNWRRVHDTGGDPLFAVAWGDGRWVASGDRGFQWSDDGETWRPGTVEDHGSGFLAVGFARPRWGWVAVGAIGVALSDDGVSWEVLPDGPRGFEDVATNGERVVGVGTGGILTSEDGRSWVQRSTPAGSDFATVVWTGSGFLAAGKRPMADGGWEPVLLRSGDGVAWTDLSHGPGVPPAPVRTLAAGPDQVLALAGDGLYISRKGERWRRIRGGPPSQDVVALQPAPDGVMALMVRPDVSGRWSTDLLLSADGVRWERRPIGGGPLVDLAARDGRYVACGDHELWSSADGVTWQRVQEGIPPDEWFYATAAGPPGFVAGNFFSPDGAEWTRLPWEWSSTGPTAIDWAGDRFVAADDGAVATSPDGRNWTFRTGFWGDWGFSHFAGNGRRIVGIGAFGLLAYSENGLDWTVVSDIPVDTFQDVLWDGSRFLVTAAGALLSSEDGVHWSREELPGMTEPGGLAVVGGRTIVPGKSGMFLFRDCPGERLEDRAGARFSVPAVAHVHGRNGTFWRSELVLHNPASRRIVTRLWLLTEAGAAAGPAPVGVVLEPGSSVQFGDLLPALFDRSEGTGGVVISSDGPLLAASRTFTVDGGGTWGQNVPLVAASAWVEAGRRVVLAGLAQDAATRTNLGLLNPGGSSLTVDVRFHGADGAVLGERSWTVPARGWRQIDLALEEAGAAPVSLAWAELDGDGGFVAYASVIDNVTGDAVTVMPADPAGGDLVVPAAAHVAGYGGVLWRTDLDLVSAGDGPARYRLELLPASGEPIESGERTLAAGHAERLADVLASVFGTQGAGAVRVVVLEGDLVASSRTYAVGAAGSFGQAVPAVAVDGGTTGAETLRLTGLAGSLSDVAGFRTDIGAVNLSDQPVSLDIELHAGDGALIGHRQLTLGAGRWGQLDRVFRGLAATPVVGGYAVITSDDDLAQVRAYASIIDNRTGDPVFLRAVAVPADR